MSGGDPILTGGSGGSVVSAKSAVSRVWIAIYYLDRQGIAPARTALRRSEFPERVRLALETRVMAIRDAPPPSFPTGSPVWS